VYWFSKFRVIVKGVYSDLEEAINSLFNVKKISDKEVFIRLLTRKIHERLVLNSYVALMALVRFINRVNRDLSFKTLTIGSVFRFLFNFSTNFLSVEYYLVRHFTRCVDHEKSKAQVCK